MKRTHLLLNSKFLLVVMLLAGSFMTSCDDEDINLEDLFPKTEFKKVHLSGANEVPAIHSTGQGMLNAYYNDDTNVITFDLTWTLGNMDDQTIGMHFHSPATPMQNAPVRIPVTGFSNSPTGKFSGQTRPLTMEEEKDLKAGLMYYNIHSTTYPSGELRGNLIK